MREVSDGWSRFHARIEEKTGRRGKRLYRYRIIRHFVSDSVHKTGFWIGDRDKVVARAEAVLDLIEAENPRNGEAL